MKRKKRSISDKERLDEIRRQGVVVSRLGIEIRDTSAAPSEFKARLNAAIRSERASRKEK